MISHSTLRRATRSSAASGTARGATVFIMIPWTLPISCIVPSGIAVAAVVVPVVDRQRLLEHDVVVAAGVDCDDVRVVVHHEVAADLVGGVREPARVLLVGRGEQQRGGVDRAGGQHELGAGDLDRPVATLGDQMVHAAAGGVGGDPAHANPGLQAGVFGRDRGVDRARLGVALGAERTGEPVAGGAADAASRRGARSTPIAFDAGFTPWRRSRRGHLGDVRLVLECRVGERRAPPGGGRVLAGRSVDAVDPLGLGVVGLEIARS